MGERALELAVDKFLFRFPAGNSYSDAGVWVKFEDGRARIGLSDFTQQRNGDVTFVEVRETGTKVLAGDEVAVVETVKVNLSVPSPASGTVIEINRDLETSPELVNQDPYGRGWLAVLEVGDSDPARGLLKNAEDFLAMARASVEKEARR